MSQPLATSATTHPGLLHPKNEDSHAVFETTEGGTVLLVCDGMGGMGRGDEASRLAVELLTKELRTGHGFPTDRLRIALRRADDEIRRQLCSTGEGYPGSTAVIVYVLEGAGHVAWVGDSRAYHVRKGRVVERTRDHKLVEELVDSGQLTPQQARASALAHVVTRALGGRSVREATVRPGAPGHVWKLLRGDRMVVMSDGICDLVGDEEIAKVTSEGSLEQVNQRFVELALERGGHDNITCVVGEWSGPDWVEEEVATPVMRPGRDLDELLNDDTMHPDTLDQRNPADIRLALLDPPSDVDDGRVTEEIASDAGLPPSPLPGAGLPPLPDDAPRLPVAPVGATPAGVAQVARPSADPEAPTEPSAGPRTATPPGSRTRPSALRPGEAPPPPPPPGEGTLFDWRFLVAIAAGIGLLLFILSWFTR